MDLRYFFLLLLAGGSVYVCIELLWRGRSHGSMFLCGGLCTVLIGMLNEWAPGLPLTAQMLLGACVITASELLFGFLFNRSYAAINVPYLTGTMYYKGYSEICQLHLCAFS